MQIDPRFQMPMAPTFDIGALLAEEREQGHSIQMNARALHKYGNDLLSDVALFVYAQSEAHQPSSPVLTEFMWIAARDGAMSLYHLGHILDTLPSLFNDCPTWKPLVDHSALRAARKRFKKSFPNATDIRHSVAHAAELYSSPDRIKINQATIKSGQFVDSGFKVGGGAEINILGGNILGDKYSVAYKGGLFQFAMNADTCLEVKEILVAFLGPLKVL